MNNDSLIVCVVELKLHIYKQLMHNRAGFRRKFCDWVKVGPCRIFSLF